MPQNPDCVQIRIVHLDSTDTPQGPVVRIFGPVYSGKNGNAAHKKNNCSGASTWPRGGERDAQQGRAGPSSGGGGGGAEAEIRDQPPPAETGGPRRQSRNATEKAFPSGCVYVRDFHPFVYMKTELSEAELQDDLLSLLHEQLALFKWKSKVQHLRAGAAAVGGGGKQASKSSLPVGSVVSGRRDALWLKKRPDLESIYGYIDREEKLELGSGTRRDDKNKKQVVYQIFTKYIIYMKILIDSLGPFSHLFELFEAHIPYNLHFLEQTRVVGMGWLKVPSALVAARIGSRKATTCDVEVEIGWKQLMQHGTNDVADSVLAREHLDHEDHDGTVDKEEVVGPPPLGVVAAGAAASSSRSSGNQIYDHGDAEQDSSLLLFMQSQKSMSDTALGFRDHRLGGGGALPGPGPPGPSPSGNSLNTSSSTSRKLLKRPLRILSLPESRPVSKNYHHDELQQAGPSQASTSSSLPFKEEILQKHWLVKALKGLWIEEGMRCEKNGLDAPEPGSPILRECGDARQSPVLDPEQQRHLKAYRECFKFFQAGEKKAPAARNVDAEESDREEGHVHPDRDDPDPRMRRNHKRRKLTVSSEERHFLENEMSRHIIGADGSFAEENSRGSGGAAASSSRRSEDEHPRMADLSAMSQQEAAYPESSRSRSKEDSHGKNKQEPAAGEASGVACVSARANGAAGVMSWMKPPSAPLEAHSSGEELELVEHGEGSSSQRRGKFRPSSRSPLHRVQIRRAPGEVEVDSGEGVSAAAAKYVVGLNGELLPDPDGSVALQVQSQMEVLQAVAPVPMDAEVPPSDHPAHEEPSPIHAPPPLQDLLGGGRSAMIEVVAQQTPPDVNTSAGLLGLNLKAGARPSDNVRASGADRPLDTSSLVNIDASILPSQMEDPFDDNFGGGFGDHDNSGGADVLRRGERQSAGAGDGRKGGSFERECHQSASSVFGDVEGAPAALAVVHHHPFATTEDEHDDGARGFLQFLRQETAGLHSERGSVAKNVAPEDGLFEEESEGSHLSEHEVVHDDDVIELEELGGMQPEVEEEDDDEQQEHDVLGFDEQDVEMVDAAGGRDGDRDHDKRDDRVLQTEDHDDVEEGDRDMIDANMLDSEDDETVSLTSSSGEDVPRRAGAEQEENHENQRQELQVERERTDEIGGVHAEPGTPTPPARPAAPEAELRRAGASVQEPGEGADGGMLRQRGRPPPSTRSLSSSDDDLAQEDVVVGREPARAGVLAPPPVSSRRSGEEERPATATASSSSSSGPVVIGERQLEVRRQEPDHNMNSSSLLIEDANPEEAAQEELLLKKKKAERATTEGVGAVDSMGRLKGAIKKAPDKVFENLKFTEFGCVLIVEAVCFGNELAMVAWRTLGGDAEAGCICNRRSVSLDLVPRRAAAAFPRRAGEDHIHQVVQDGDRTDNPPTSFPYQPCAGVLEVPLTSTNGTTSPRAGGGGRVTGGEIPTVLQMAENQSAVFNAVELLVKRLEPNLLLSYDVPEGLGLILHHGRRENMQQRLSRVPGEEPRGFGFAPTAEQGKMTLAGGGGPGAFLAGGTKAGVGFGGVPLYNQQPVQLGIKAANAFTTSEHFPARVGSSAMAYRASGASGRLDNSAPLSQNSDKNNQDVLVSRPDFDPGNHTSSSSSDQFGAHNAGGPQQNQNEDADSDDEKQYRAKYPAEKLTGGVSLKGRLTFSLWRVLRKQAKLPNTELNTACEQLVGETFPSFDTATLRTLCRNPGTALFAALYLVKKCTASFNILLSMNLLTKCAEVARLLGVDFFSVLSRGSQFRVESILSRAAHSDRYLLFTPTKDQVRYQRAHECTPLVLEPKSDFYYDPVLVVDFQSLYPSIMIAYNMCFSTCVGRVEVAEKLLKEAFDFRKMENSCKNPSTTKEHPNWIARLVEAVLRAETVEQEGGDVEQNKSGARSELRDEVRHLLQKRKLGCLSEYAPSGFLEDSLACPNGAIFVQHFKGVVTKMIHEILQTRIMLKKSLKLHRKANKASADLERLLEARIFGLKMVANVTYGYIGAAFSGRMPCSDIADAIVYTARRTLEDTMRLIEREFPHCEVVYGDTDSVFVRVKRCHNLQHAFRVGQAIVRKTTERHPWPMELELEKVYWPCCLVSKKRYVGYSYSSPTQEVPSFDAKGIETVRRDSCRWTQQEMKNVLEIMFSGVREHLMRENDAGASSGGAAAAGGVVLEEHLSSHQAVDDAAAPPPPIHLCQSIDDQDESTPGLAWRRRKLKLVQRNVRRARLYFVAQAKRIRENRVPKTDLLFYKETRRLEDYAVLPVHAYIVDKGKLVPNKRVPYGIGTGPGRLLDKARAPQNFGEPDAEYYLHKHLVPALQRCFALIGEDVKSWLPLKPRTYFLDVRNQASSSTDQGTLARFLKRTCAFCNATLPLANYEVVDVEWKYQLCLPCRRNPARIHRSAKFRERFYGLRGAQEGGGRDPSLTDIEDGYCAPCVGAGPAQLGQLCTTFDCEKLGQKMLALARTEGTALHDVV